MKYQFEITGSIPSIKNSLKKGRYGFYTDSKVTEWFDDCIKQISIQKIPKLAGKVYAEMFIIDSDRNDTNNQISSLCDLLEHAGVVQNDRQITKIFADKTVITKKNKLTPKTLIKIELLD